MYNEARKKATMKYQAEKMDRVYIRVKKGEKEKVHEYVKAHGESLQAYILRLIAEDMQSNS